MIERPLDGTGSSGTAGGTTISYRHSVELCETFGQAKSLRVRFFGHRKSPNARATLRVFETSVTGGRPQEFGSEITVTQVYTALRPNPFNVTGPFEGRLEIVLEIDANPPGNPEEFDLEVYVTLILEE